MTDHDHNRRRHWRIQLESLGLIVVLFALTALVTGSIFGSTVAIFTLIVLCTVALLAPGIPSQLVMRMHRARALDAIEAPELHGIVSRLSRTAGLAKPPRCYLLPSMQLNAFATGSPEDGAIAVSAGMLRHLNRHQLSGVIAHEIGHLAHRDIAVLGLASQLARTIQTLASVTWLLMFLAFPLFLFGALSISPLTLLLLIVAPNAALLLVQALSRSREYAADNHAALLLGSPRPLAEALSMLDQQQHGPWWLTGFQRTATIPTWLRSHPPTAERIERLLEVERSGLHNALDDENLIIPERIPMNEKPRPHRQAQSGGPTIFRFG